MPSSNHLDCQEFRNRLNEILEAELQREIPEALKGKLLEHGKSCVQCGEILRTYGALLSGLAALPRIKAPGDFARRIRERIEGEGIAPAQGNREKKGAVLGGRFKLPSILLRAAAIVLFAIGGWWAGQHFLKEKEGIPPIARAPEPAAPRLDEVTETALEPFFKEKERAAESLALEQSPEPSLQAPLKKGMEVKAGEAEEEAIESRSPSESKGLGENLIVIHLPPQSAERMGSLLTSMKSFVPDKETLELKDVPVARKRIISLEVDASGVEPLLASLAGFKEGTTFLAPSGKGDAEGLLRKRALASAARPAAAVRGGAVKAQEFSIAAGADLSEGKETNRSLDFQKGVDMKFGTPGSVIKLEAEYRSKEKEGRPGEAADRYERMQEVVKSPARPSPPASALAPAPPSQPPAPAALPQAERSSGLAGGVRLKRTIEAKGAAGERGARPQAEPSAELPEKLAGLEPAKTEKASREPEAGNFSFGVDAGAAHERREEKDRPPPPAQEKAAALPRVRVEIIVDLE